MKEFEISQELEEILWAIAEDGGSSYASRIAKKLGKTRSTVTSQLSDLEQHELVEGAAGGNPRYYELIRNGYQLLMQSELSNTDLPRIRHHKISVQFPLVSGFDDIPDDERHNTVKLCNWVKFSGSIDTDRQLYREEVSYFITPHFVVVRLPEIQAACTDQGIANATVEAIQSAREIKEVLEQRYSEVKLGSGSVEFVDHHYALTGHPVAAALDRIDLTGKLSDFGDSQLVVDRSVGVPEIEVEGCDAEDYADILTENLNFLANVRLKPFFEDSERSDPSGGSE